MIRHRLIHIEPVLWLVQVDDANEDQYPPYFANPDCRVSFLIVEPIHTHI